jgi:hypothetical protein
MDFIEPNNKQEINDFFAVYLASKERDQSHLDLYTLFGDKYFLFLTLMEGNSISIPNLNRLKSLQQAAEVYVEMKVNGKSKQQITDEYDLTATEVTNKVNQVENTLDKFDVRDDIDYSESEFAQAFQEYKSTQ